MLPRRAFDSVPVRSEPRSGGAPRVVAIGGGTGLPNVLRGIRPLLYPEGVNDANRDRLVAIVATSDDGGSSGRLRAEFNMIPPGDIRNCLAALSDNGSQFAEMFQYRFESGDGLSGHAMGNLMIAALADVTRDFALAVEAASRMLGACGVVLPATSELVTLVAEFTDGRVLSGESAIAGAGGTIARLSLLPERPLSSSRVVEAVERADVVVVGPGSLYTSILPPLLVPHVSEALFASRAVRILVANLMTEAGETDNFSVLDHLLTLERHLGRQLFDCVIYNTSPIPEPLATHYKNRRAAPIVTGTFELSALDRFGVRAIGVPLVSEHPAGKIRHHPERLASAITALAQGKLGAWRSRAELGDYLTMYERFYQLRERPFALSPDPEYLYPSRVHQEALDYLRYGLESQAGFIVITGEIGSGKTTLLQTLLRNVDGETTVGRIVNTMLEPRELLESIMIDFGLDPAGKSKPLLLRDLSQYLVDQRLAGRNVLLVIDEAQNLSLGALEELRMLSNLETEKSKLVQIVLVGQPDLRDKLAAPALEQLRQRITVSYHLPPLDVDETGAYINHRLRRAAAGPPLEFPRDATDLIHGRSRGVPRIINVICDAALVFGYAEERRTFDAPTIAEVLQELEATGVLPPTVAAARPAVATATAGEGTAAAAPAPVALAAPPAAAAAAAQATLAQEAARRRDIELQERERMVRQRERELAEQRRVLAEEYRLLRTRAAAPPPPPNTARPHAAARFDMAAHESFWQRVKRIMLGVSTS